MSVGLSNPANITNTGALFSILVLSKLLNSQMYVILALKIIGKALGLHGPGRYEH
jgi:hypothetical protein